MTTALSTITSLCIALAVMLSGAYAKELSSIQFGAEAGKKAGVKEGSIKLVHDPHTHVDKQTLRTAMHASGRHQAEVSARQVTQQRTPLSARLSLRLRGLLQQYLKVSYA